MKNLVLALSAALALTLAATAAVAVSGGAPSVGDLVLQVAQRRQMPAASPQEARAMLERAGSDLSGLDLDTPLTERTLVRVCNAVGLAVTTRDPDAPVDAERLRRFLSVLGPEITRSGSAPQASSSGTPGPYPRPNDHAADPLSKGKGKKKGIPRSPSDPAS